MKKLLITILFISAIWPQCDANGDGELNVTDIIEQVICIIDDCWESNDTIYGSWLLNSITATINDLPLGRNIEETLRLVDALQFHEKHGEVCPAGWKDGDPGMQPTTDGVASYLTAHGDSL